MEAFKEVSDCLCVGQKSTSKDEERVVLFLKMAEGTVFGDDVLKPIRAEIRQQLSARHVPAVILPIDDIPVSIKFILCNSPETSDFCGNAHANVHGAPSVTKLQFFKDFLETLK